MRPRGIVAAVTLLLAAGGTGAALAWQDHVEDQRWRHGGDAVVAEAEVRTAAPDTFRRTALALGAARRDAFAVTPTQHVVARVSWSGTPEGGGSYQFLVLDDRLAQPEPLVAVGGWVEGRGTGTHWDGRYGVLAERYDWLARTADRRVGSSWTNDTEAVGVPATRSGEVTLAFRLDKGTVPSSGLEDFVVAMFLVGDDGEVQWAKQVPVSAPPG